MSSPGVTLGAYHGKGLSTIPDRETLYWRPCATRSGLLDDKGRADTHAWFIASNYCASIFCPSCRVKPKGQRGFGAEERKAAERDLPF